MKKKREKKKKIITDYGIHRAKKGVLHFEWEKDKLFMNLPMNMFTKELEDNGIILNKRVLLEEYNKTHKFNDLINKYIKLYEKQLDILDEKNELFDGDCIFYYLKRIIENNIDIWKLSDPDFIFGCLEDIIKFPISIQKKKILDIIRSINELKDFYDEDNLDRIFAQTCYDYIEAIYDIYATLNSHRVFKHSEFDQHQQELEALLVNYENTNKLVAMVGSVIFAEKLKISLDEGVGYIKEFLGKYPCDDLKLQVNWYLNKFNLNID